MDKDGVLEILMSDLQISVNNTTEKGKAIIAFLNSLIDRAEERLRTEGVHVDYEDAGDALLVETYAAWMYRVRTKQDGNTAMPIYLRREINNRLFREAGEDDD